MLKQEKRKFLLPLLVFCFVFSCINNNDIQGQWENDSRIIAFENGKFEIYYKNSSVIKKYSGKYTNDNNKILLYFENYMNFEGIWFQTKGTEMENFIESFEYDIIENKLETFIISSEKYYYYDRIE